jgi:hypothetical protein
MEGQMANTPKLKAVDAKVDIKDDTPIVPVIVGNPISAASLAIDQSHLEEFANPEAESASVECQKPPKGIFFTVRPETSEQWKDRAFYFLLEIKDRDPYLVAPAIAKKKMAEGDEDTIRPVLIVRYVTMAGDEGLWPLKLDSSDGKANPWNKSALTILKEAESRWVRLISKKGHYGFTPSKKKTLQNTPARFSNRTLTELVDLSFKDHIVITDDHEIWDILEHGSDK